MLLTALSVCFVVWKKKIKKSFFLCFVCYSISDTRCMLICCEEVSLVLFFLFDLLIEMRIIFSCQLGLLMMIVRLLIKIYVFKNFKKLRLLKIKLCIIVMTWMIEFTSKIISFDQLRSQGRWVGENSPSFSGKNSPNRKNYLKFSCNWFQKQVYRFYQYSQSVKQM